jgi:hypothetical protein
MKRITAILCGTAALAFGPSAIAAPVTSDYSKIKQIDTYAGDTTVFLEKNPIECEQGFWMRPTQAGFKDKLSALEKAAHQNTRVKIKGDNADLWKQLDKPNCRLDTVEFEPVPNAGTKADLDGENPLDVRRERAEEEKRLLEQEKATEAQQQKKSN